jgi:hypothetical protein
MLHGGTGSARARSLQAVFAAVCVVVMTMSVSGPPAVAQSSGSPLVVSTTIPSGLADLAVDSSTDTVFVTSTTASEVTELDFNGDVLGSVAVIGASGIVTIGNDLYVASYAGITEIDGSTLQVIGSVPLPLTASMTPLVYSAGALWTTAIGPLLVRVDPASLGSTTYPASLGLLGPYGGTIGLSGGDDYLFSYATGISPVSINELTATASTAAPTVVVPDVNEGNIVPEGISNLEDAGLTPDGTTLVTAAGYPYEFTGINTSTLASINVIYPGTYYPSAVALTSAAGGLVAGGTESTDEVYVYKLGQPSDLVLNYQFAAAGLGLVPEVDPHGLAFSPDGSRLFAVTTNTAGRRCSRSFKLAAGTAPPAGYGSISGVVTASGTAVAGACVYASAVHGSAGSLTTTANFGPVTSGSDGSYDLNVPPGTYTVLFDPTCDGTKTSPYAFQFYANNPDLVRRSRFPLLLGTMT